MSLERLDAPAAASVWNRPSFRRTRSDSLMHRLPALDHLGAMRESVALGMPLIYLGLSAVLVALALLGRRLKLQRR
ncbi:MAG: hypothetical protein GY719_06085 [bacterium]|nr:hypothetical protein [bacterium]